MDSRSIPTQKKTMGGRKKRKRRERKERRKLLDADAEIPPPPFSLLLLRRRSVPSQTRMKRTPESKKKTSKASAGIVTRLSYSCHTYRNHNLPERRNFRLLLRQGFPASLPFVLRLGLRARHNKRRQRQEVGDGVNVHPPGEHAVACTEPNLLYGNTRSIKRRDPTGHRIRITKRITPWDALIFPTVSHPTNALNWINDHLFRNKD